MSITCGRSPLIFKLSTQFINFSSGTSNPFANAPIPAAPKIAPPAIPQGPAGAPYVAPLIPPRVAATFSGEIVSSIIR